MLSINEIKRFIADDETSEKKRFAREGQNYYEGKHDIRNYRLFYYDADGILQEDKTRSNIKISHPFFTELSDQLTSYLLSFGENPIRAKEQLKDNQQLQEQLDMYFDESFWAEIQELVAGAYNKGFEYIYAYVNNEGRLAFECADSIGVVEVRAKDTDDKCEYIIYWYIDRIEKGKKTIKRIQVWSDKDIAYYVQSGNGKIKVDDSVEINPRPHAMYKDNETGKLMGYQLGYIPFWRLDNNRKQISGLRPVKNLIDDYDLHSCSLSNNLVDFDTPLHVVKGFDGNDMDKLQQNLKTKKLVGVDAEGGIDVKTVDVPYQARKEKLEIDEKNIYRFGFGLNTLGLKDTSATTNIAIKAAYSLLDMKANRMETALKRTLKNLVKVVLDEINEELGTSYKSSDVVFNFERNIMVNEQENAQIDLTIAQTKQVEINTILNVAATLDDETVLKNICAVMDIDYEDIKNKVPDANEAGNSLITAKSTLNDIFTDDETTDIKTVQ